MNYGIPAWLFRIALGFFSGSVMYCAFLPKLLCGKDPAALSDDRNPGAANVFTHCGVVIGLLCLLLDLLKGFVPVWFAAKTLDTHNLAFALVMLAPVLGHAIAPLNHFHGGKCITASFGVLLAVLPQTRAVFFLAGLYIFFAAVVRMRSNRRMSILVFGLFGLCAGLLLLLTARASLGLGCAAVSATAIVRHSKFFAVASKARNA